jgi:hypothetical protein
MEFSEKVLTKAKSGKIELRALDSRGGYVLCKYLDPKTLKLADKKKKLTLRDEDGNIQEYFIIPLKDNRSLLVTGEQKEKDRKIWNEKTKKEEEMWDEN